MRRRWFLVGLGGTAATPFAAWAQPGERVRRIGALMAFAEDDPRARIYVKGFEQRLRDLGWTIGDNLRIDYVWAAGNLDRMRSGAAALVALAPDVIVASDTPTLRAAHQATSTVPIVFVVVADPVGGGLIASLAHPGGNITGFASVEPSLASKWLELLKEIVPGLARVGLLYDPETAGGGGTYFWRPLEAAAPSFAVEPLKAPVHNAQELERAIGSLAREPPGGVIVMPDAFTTVNRDQIISLAARYRVPAIYPYRYFSVGGGLLSYGNDNVESYRGAASYVDRILRGEKPADLPVQAPAKYELVINLKTAKALGVEIPPMLLARADEVIE
jgi:putative tryptophan/tyrosine transport system substrate-binding protein